jgi:hypothetical protein
VYLIQNNQKVGFRDPAEYASYGYNFNQVVPVSDGDKALPTALGTLKALPGTLVLDTSDNRTVYMIGTGSTKRGFASADVFNGLGYNFNDLARINLSDYSVGPAVGDASLAHPDGALVLDNGTVWWLLGGNRLGFESVAVFNTYGFSWNKIVKANAADINLPQGPLVKFRDGTLVYDSGNYYLISDRKKLMFASVTDLTNRGYKTTNAIQANISAYESGGTVQ